MKKTESDDKKIAAAREEVETIRNELESGLHALRRRQLAAIEKVRVAVDRRRADKVRESIDAIGPA
jgi:hypothetical protein